jgi:hypothetical protein
MPDQASFSESFIDSLGGNSPIARREADLAQGIVKAGILGDLGEFDVVVDVPARALFNVADHQPPH